MRFCKFDFTTSAEAEAKNPADCKLLQKVPAVETAVVGQENIYYKILIRIWDSENKYVCIFWENVLKAGLKNVIGRLLGYEWIENI